MQKENAYLIHRLNKRKTKETHSLSKVGFEVFPDLPILKERTIDVLKRPFYSTKHSRGLQA